MTAPAPTQLTPVDVKALAVQAWDRSGGPDRNGARLTGWTVDTAPDKTPMVSATVTGPNAERAVLVFAGQFAPAVQGPGARKPYVDYEPGGVACLWRTEGVWVRLFAPEQRHPKPSAPQTPRPATKPSTAVRPSARLPYRRNTTTTKEN